MNIFPQDLRDRQHATIVQRRSYGVYSASSPSYMTGDPPPPRRGRLGRLWTRDSNLTPEQAATGLPAASMQTLSSLWVLPSLGVPLSALVGLLLAKPASPRRSRWRARRRRSRRRWAG